MLPSMLILAVNCGSSSLKCALVDSVGGRRVLDVRIENIGTERAALWFDGRSESVAAKDVPAAMARILEAIGKRGAGNPQAVAHRIVHGGEQFREPTQVTDEVLTRLEALSSLAPLHNPPAVAALRLARERLPVPHVAVFDTAFHSTLPPRSRDYALPLELSRSLGLRRYGFHGISHAHVARTVAEQLRQPVQQLRIISCHLGNGASVAAIEYGRSIDTSMGMTPLEGLMMGTRAGDIDAGILLHLLRRGHDVERLDALLNRESGLAGLTGTNDARVIQERAAGGDEACRLALTLYAHRLRKYIGAYAAVMGGVDAIAFTGGIGEHSALIRARTLQRLDFLGARLNEDRNGDAHVSESNPVEFISEYASKVALLVVRADEERTMAEAVAALLEQMSPAVDRRVPVAVSARHVHLTQASVEALFGKGHVLKPRKDLSQHGQYASEEVVSLLGPVGRIDRVRVLGPPRKADQVEISRTDEFVLGVDAPVRVSGDLANTPGIMLEGPAGRLRLKNGVVCARRHIHMNPADAERLGLEDHAVVSVRIDSDGRDLTFNDVMVRVAPDFELELHLDTDEANAAGVTAGMTGEILV